MATLPARPDLGHLRREARDLLRAAQAGDTAAAGRISAVSGGLNLSAAQLAVARDYGFASWPRLKAAVEARSRDLAGAGAALLRGQHQGLVRARRSGCSKQRPNWPATTSRPPSS